MIPLAASREKDSEGVELGKGAQVIGRGAEESSVKIITGGNWSLNMGSVEVALGWVTLKSLTPLCTTACSTNS